MDTSALIRLHLFGSFRLERDEQPVDLPTRKVASLLAYLALHPEPHAREKIATLFWGDFSDAHARRSLRTALAALRKELGNDLLLTDRETVQLNPQQSLWVDAKEFQIVDFKLQIDEAAQSAIHNLQSAIELYQGDLLAGFDDEWIAPERERYRALYLDVLLQLTQRLRTQGEYARAIETARKVLATDAANEQAHQQLMSCHFALGDREAALQQYAECKHALREELSVEPSPETVALYQRIQQTKAPHPSVATARTNLPIPLTSFIGRTRELTTVKQLLATARLLTLTGVGGCGKTRLAIEVGASLADAYPDGVWWVELAALSDEALVPQAVAKVLSVQERPNEPLQETLTHVLRSRQLLLVLDNCEHLVLACARLAETLLTQCPQVQILATSREALGISGEVAWLVPSLSLPAAEVASAPEALLQSEGIRLFVERASAVRPDFVLTPTNAQAVVRVCRQLEGIPLALELAAARVKTLSLDQIAERLDDRFRLLTLGSRTALPRQQTLRATLDWSYDLLTEPERVLFRRLSVFAGGWTLEAAEYVCKDEGTLREMKDELHESEVFHPSSLIPHPSEVLDVLTQLVNKSLVLAEARDAEIRYRMLETIRQYAREKLMETDEEKRLRAAHLDFFSQLADVAYPQIFSSEQEHWLARLENAHDDVRAALGWAIEQGEIAAALHLSGAIGRFWEVRGYWSEGRQWLQQVLSLSHHVGSSSAERGWYARALSQAGILTWLQGDFALARGLLERSLTLYRELGDQAGSAHVLSHMGILAHEQGDYARARLLYEEILEIYRDIGNKVGIAASLFLQGLTAFDQRDPEAQSLFEESLVLRREIGEPRGISYSLNGLGNVAYVKGDYATAQVFFSEALMLRRQVGDKRGDAATLNDLGNVQAKQGNYKEARELYTESLIIHNRLANKRDLASALSGLARAAHAEKRLQFAVILLSAAEVLLTRMNARLDAQDQIDNEQAVVALRAQLNEAAFAEAWATGCALTLEQAIAEALKV